jgi:small-conductance mechanosensitive channel
MTRSVTLDELVRLLDSLLRPTALLEAGLVIGCLALAGIGVRVLRGSQAEPGSTWFGDRIVDGVLFPLLALLLVWLAHWLSGLPAQPLLPMAVFRLAEPILLSLALIRLAVRVLRITFPGSKLVGSTERSLSWVAWAGVVLWITGLLPLMLQELDAIHWKIGSTQISVRSAIEGALTGIVVLMLALWAASLIESRLLRGAPDNLSLRKMVANAARIGLLFIGLMFALSAAGIDLTALGVVGGALGVGLGFGLQKLAANYVSGFVILAEHSMRIGDTVKVDNFEGRITDISTRFTVIRALNGRESIVPNEMMITQRVENSSLADPRVLLTTQVQVAYGTDLDSLMPRLVAAATGVPRVLSDPAPAVLLSNFAADGLELTLAFWIDDLHNGQGNVRSGVNLAILRTLNDNGIEIPFPQRVVRQLPN